MAWFPWRRRRLVPTPPVPDPPATQPGPGHPVYEARRTRAEMRRVTDLADEALAWLAAGQAGPAPNPVAGLLRATSRGEER